MEETKKKKEAVPRKDRRMEARYQRILRDLVVRFVEIRSGLTDPDGELSANTFTILRDQWIKECNLFNKTNFRSKARVNFTLNYAAFDDMVKEVLDNEKKSIAKANAEKKDKAFQNWFKRAHVWRTRPLQALWIAVISLFNQETQVKHWETIWNSLPTNTVKS
jgi:hypothetical protein